MLSGRKKTTGFAVSFPDCRLPFFSDAREAGPRGCGQCAPGAAHHAQGQPGAAHAPARSRLTEQTETVPILFFEIQKNLFCSLSKRPFVEFWISVAKCFALQCRLYLARHLKCSPLVCLVPKIKMYSLMYVTYVVSNYYNWWPLTFALH